MAMTLITTNTETNAASSSFTSGIDSTYKLYIFKFIDINPATDDANFAFQTSTDGGSNYNLETTSSFFRGKVGEDGDGGNLAYESGYDFADSTSFIRLSVGIGNGSDESTAGTMWLFNPSSTTYVKHWYARFSMLHEANQSWDNFASGYVNTTSDIDAIQFKMESGNMDGTIKMYGVG